MKLVELTRGMVACVDDADWPLVSPYNWHVLRGRNTNYAVANVVRDGRRSSLLMHRLIAGAGPSQQVDHRDLNGLNNQRGNIRLCTRSQNCSNADRRRRSTAYKGISLREGRIYARIQVEGKTLTLGRFETVEDAARAYDAAALRFFGEFARLNFPDRAV